MKNTMLLMLPLFALSMLLTPSPTEGSPPIRHRTKQHIDKQTDFLLRAKIIHR